MGNLGLVWTLLVAFSGQEAPPPARGTAAAPGSVLTASDRASASAKVDALLGRVVHDDTPGAAVMVLCQGEVLHQKGYGLANLENRVPITPKTTFDLASFSKQFTAYALLILAEEKRLDLRDDVRKHLPELPADWNAESNRDRPVRIDDLLHHVSGIPDYLRLSRQFPKRDDEMTNADVAALLARQKLDFPTGSRFAYSNSNYLLAALIVERVTGGSFGRFVTTRIFLPLGMANSFVFDRATQVVPDRAYGYGRGGGGSGGSGGSGREWQWIHSDLSVTGDGGIWTCLEDLVKWDAELADPQLVDAALLDQAFTSGNLDAGEATGYGFGWSVSRAGDEPVVEHSGGWAGFLTHHLRFLDSGLTVIVLCNRADGEVAPQRLAHQIARLYRSAN